MTGKRLFAFAIVMMLGAHGCAEDITPSEIFEKVRTAYKSMETYKAEGSITSDIDTTGMKRKTEASFSILLKRPNLYLIFWTYKNSAVPGMVQSGAVWRDGTQPYLYMEMMNAYSKMASDEHALVPCYTTNDG